DGWRLAPLQGALDTQVEPVDAVLSALALQRHDLRRSVQRPLPLAPLARPPRRPPLLPLEGLERRLEGLGIDAAEYSDRHALSLVPEPASLALAGRDRYHRPLFLLPGAARAW